MVAYLLSGQVPDSSLSIVLLFSSWSTGVQEMTFQLLTLGWGGGVAHLPTASNPPLARGLYRGRQR